MRVGVLRIRQPAVLRRIACQEVMVQVRAVKDHALEEEEGLVSLRKASNGRVTERQCAALLRRGHGKPCGGSNPPSSAAMGWKLLLAAALGCGPRVRRFNSDTSLKTFALLTNDRR